jgi:hypothetical protein
MSAEMRGALTVLQDEQHKGVCMKQAAKRKQFVLITATGSPSGLAIVLQNCWDKPYSLS